MVELRPVICPDADRFPLSDADRALAASAGLRLIEIPGHEIEQFEIHGHDVVGSLAWGGRYGAELMDAMPRLRVLARCGTGLDNIDLDAADQRRIVVTYVPGASDEEVSDHVIALILACLRQLVFSDMAVRAGKWPSAAELTSMRRVRGTSLGLVGFGRIASAVAAKATCLGMDVSAFDPYLPAESFMAKGVHRHTTLMDLLGNVDVVSLHLPPSPDGRAILGSDELRAMRTGAIFINTGRGSLVDEEALTEELSTGRLSAAGLDVFQREPLPASSRLLELGNVVLTPHSAAFSEHALGELRQSAIRDVITVLDGGAPTYPAQPERKSSHGQQ